MASERKFVAENVRRVLLKEYLMKEVSRAGFGGLDVQRTPMGTSVILATERPGLVIGRKGQTIKNLTMVIEDRFGFENPQIEVHEVENANVNAQIMAEKLAFSLERGWHFRRAGHSSVRRIMESGAKGCHIIISGKLTGQRHRTEKFKDGYIKFCGEPKLKFMDRGYAVAKLKQGVVGVTVEIMAQGARLPADIMVLDKAEVEMQAAPVVDTPVEVVEEKPKKTTKKKAAETPVEATPEVVAEAVAEKPKKAPAKKKAVEAPAEAAPEPSAEVVEEKPKKTAKKKADAEMTEAAEEKPKKAPAKKTAAKKDADAEEKPKKAPAKKKADAEGEVTTEAAPKKAPAKKAAAKKDADSEEKPKKAPAKKKADAPADADAEKPKKTTKKKAAEEVKE